MKKNKVQFIMFVCVVLFAIIYHYLRIHII